MQSIIINDNRTKFTQTTFSNNKKTNVINNLKECIYYCKIEEAFFWTGELLCSNYLLDIWNVYFIIMCKYIHIQNPKLPIYMHKKYYQFKNIMEKDDNIINLRNNNNLRYIFCSITYILCHSNKLNILDDINCKFDFKIETMYSNLKAPNIEYIKFIYRDNDPSEYIVPINEFIYHLKDTKNNVNILFWLNWIIEYDILCRKKKKYILCEERFDINTSNNTIKRNVIWIIWDIIIELSKTKNTNIQAIINNLFDLFKIKYILTFNKKRVHMLYNSIQYLIQNDINFDIKVLNGSCDNLEHNINITFQQLKKFEKTEKLKSDIKLTKSQEKINKYKDIYNNFY